MSSAFVAIAGDVLRLVRNIEWPVPDHGRVSSTLSPERARRSVAADRRWLGAAIGLLAAGVTLGVGELVAALFRPAASPILAVGNRVVVLTPAPVKRWAIREFGTGDKHALLTGTYLVLAGCAVAIGVLAIRRPRIGRFSTGPVGVGLLGLFACYCALTAPAARISDVFPSLIGALAGRFCLQRLLARAAPDETGEAVLADRRRFLIGAGLAAGTAVFGGVLGRAWQRTRFDAAGARSRIVLPPPASSDPPPRVHYDLGKSGVPFQTPNADFYRIDTALAVPQLNPATWQLRIHGRVNHELRLSYADLLARPLVERWITLACVSNEVGGDLISTARFRGVLLADLLREAGVHPDADQLLATSADGMTIGSPTAAVMDGRDAMLALGMNDEPLPIEHGFPVRMVVPGLYGYVSACKWIVDLEATTFARDRAYWVDEGWAQLGPVRLASRIDRPSASQKLAVGQSVAVAGVAWDQHVGVSAVEVQIDNEPWQPATLAPVPSTDTWRQWVLLWTPDRPGKHQLRVRAYDTAGHRQDENQRDPFPSGSTGLHTITVTAA